MPNGIGQLRLETNPHNPKDRQLYRAVIITTECSLHTPRATTSTEYLLWLVLDKDDTHAKNNCVVTAEFIRVSKAILL